jgi:hypothetical protein
MKAWLENLVGPDYASALLWTIVLIRIARGLSVGTFVSGGRNRKTRLAVMDATAVDSHRRLVLVRRDDVEHLILIGGPTDVVVEQNIRLASPTRRAGGDEPYPPHFHDHPHAPEEPRAPRHAEPAPRPAAPRPAPPQPVSAPVAALTPARPEPRPSQPAAAAHGTPSYGTPAAPRPVPAPATGIQPMRPVVASAPAASTAPHVAPPVHKPDAPAKADLDDALAKELEVTLDKEVSGAPRPQPAPAPQPAASASLDDALDEEMSKLLSDLAGKR